MKLFELIKSALYSLWSSKTRTALSMLGIIIGISSVIVIIGFSEGQSQSIEEQFASSGANRLSVSISGQVARSVEFTEEDISMLKLAYADRINLISPSMSETGSYTLNREDYTINATGTNGDYDEIYDLDIMYGDYFTDEDVTRKSDIIVLDNLFAADIFGTEDAVGETILIDYGGYKREYTIIGIYESDEDSGAYTDDTNKTIYVPYTSFPTYSGTFNKLEIDLMDSDSITEDSEAIVETLEKIHNNEGEEDYRTFSLSSIADMMETVMSTLTLVLVAIAAISLLVGGIGVMNIMLVSVTERTREIGIRKAIGAKRGDILIQFVIESIVITGLGGALGVLIGIAILAWTTPIVGVPLVISFWAIGLAVGFSSLLGVFFGIYPAYRASSLAPVDALRYE
ncbi:ABC transporter permease [Clostridia bacterium]|nr:ABC transporter permease [Clostridia bacterium]